MPQVLSKEHVKKRDRLTEDHLLPSKLQRYKRGQTYAERAQSALFNQTDAILDEVYVDICNGVARADIVQKLMKGGYESQIKQEKTMTYRTANVYWNTALDRLHYNTDIEHARLKDVFFNRYEKLLEKAIKEGDLYNARGILDSMTKTFLGNDKEKNLIEINANDGAVVIKFGFNDDDDKEEENKVEEGEYIEVE